MKFCAFLSLSKFKNWARLNNTSGPVLAHRPFVWHPWSKQTKFKSESGLLFVVCCSGLMYTETCSWSPTAACSSRGSAAAGRPVWLTSRGQWRWNYLQLSGLNPGQCWWSGPWQRPAETWRVNGSVPRLPPVTKLFKVLKFKIIW